jgi:hypothetical protein
MLRLAAIGSAVVSCLFVVQLIRSIALMGESSIVLSYVGAILVLTNGAYVCYSFPQTLTVTVQSGMLLLRRQPRELWVPVGQVNRVLQFSRAGPRRQPLLSCWIPTETPWV